jgi:hypothetical protein
MKRVIYVLTIYAGILLGLSVFCQRGRSETRPTAHRVAKYDQTNLGRQESSIDIYVKPGKRPSPSPSPTPNPTPRPRLDPRRADAATFSALYEKGRAGGTIVIFGAEWCGWCKFQLAAIPDGYRVLYVDIEKEGGKWRRLMTQWRLVEKGESVSLPTTAMVVDGLPVKSWTAAKPWRVLKEHVQKAKKNEDDTKRTRIDYSGNRGYSDRGRSERRQPSRPIRRWVQNLFSG